MVRRFKRLRRIVVSFKMAMGPPLEDKLEAQRLILEEARSIQPLLVSVSFRSSVTWTVNGSGHWTATYQSRRGKMTLMSPLDYLPAEETLGHRYGENGTLHDIA